MVPPLIELPHPSPLTSPRVIGVCEGRTADFILGQSLDHGYLHVVQRDSLAYGDEIEASRILLDEPARFFQCPLASILTPKDVTASREKSHTRFVITLRTRAERANALVQADSAMKDVVNAGVLRDLSMIAGELVSNAILHGPASRPDHEPEACRLRLGYDEERVVICCEDQYGALDVGTLLTRVRRGFIHGASEILNFGEGGAGIGSLMIFQAAASVYYAVDEGKRTTICVAIPARGGHRTRQLVAKNVHWFKGRI